MSDFVHLHLHSEYSLLDGACRIAEIPRRAKECGHTAVALTDHGSMYGAIAFYNACVKEGIQPIIGCEVYVAPRSMSEKSGTAAHPYHLVLLCENEIGYRNLVKLVSAAYLDGFYAKPRVDLALLKEHASGLIALSACLAGKVPQMLLQGDLDGACRAATELSQIFGKDHFYIELQDHGLAEQQRLLPQLVEVARVCGLPLVATNDCHYLRRSDAKTQAVLMCIQTNTRLSDGKPLGFETDEFYYKTTEEMQALFGAFDGAIENTVKIADRCRFAFDFQNTFLPKFPCPAGKSAAEHLRALAEQGFASREKNGRLATDRFPLSVYRTRMEYELSVIEKMGYSDYFLIVQDYVNYAISKSIPVGPGRGSGAGSIVAFFLGITDVDPIAFDLLFERFLNPERVSMPDIDMDFCYNRRDEVIRYVTEKYGRDHVSQIVTFNTLAARAAIRDVGRALGMPSSEVDAAAKAIPRELNITIENALRLPDLKKLYAENEQIRTLVDIAKGLEGMPRNVSIHAAGIVITEKPLTEYLPLAQSNGAVITQYDKDMVEALGLLKFDFLGLRYLTIINDAVLQIRRTRPTFDIEKISLDDKDTYRLIARGATSGVFQLESGGMRQTLMNLEPNCFDDIVAAIALYRPGPMDSIPKFIENRKDPSRIVYRIPQLEPILRSTRGCIVYQEQVMQIFRELAGFTFGHADIVRRAMAKKKMSVLQSEKAAFLEGCAQNGIATEDALAIFEEMSSFANYAFNKSHAAAYAVISYRTAYLKEHYPKEFFAALLTSELGNMPKIAAYIAEVSKRGIRVLPPDINDSQVTFSVSDQSIRFGLLALKNVGRAFLEAAVDERERNGRYASFDDFLTRMSTQDINKRQIESLIKSGAFDALGVFRSQLMAVYESMIDQAQADRRSNITGQIDMFAAAQVESPRVVYPKLPEYSTKELLMQERAACGLYFSGHLLDGYEKALAAISPDQIKDLFETDENEEYLVPDRKRVCVAGIVSEILQKTTRKYEKMAFFTLEDRFGEIECVAFPKVLGQIGALLARDQVVKVTGNVSLRDDDPPKILVSELSLLPDNETFAKSGIVAGAPSVKTLYLRVPSLDDPRCAKALAILGAYPGSTPVIFYDNAKKSYHKQPLSVLPNDACISALQALLGEANVVPK